MPALSRDVTGILKATGNAFPLTAGRCPKFGSWG
jgi:hypothetical protein